MHKILVADKIADEGLELLRGTPGVEVEVRLGLSPSGLAGVLGEYDGVLIRSSVKITKETLANPGKLSVIARAGVGVDNVDVDAATAGGVLVLNTPDANTISTAEHTVALMLSLHHRVPEAHAHVAAGGWNRASFEGSQLAGRTLGIVGLGRIGRAVAQRALALDMEVIAFDPFVTGETALNGAVRMVPSFEDCLKQADVLTLHATLSSETRHMIGSREIGMMKRGACLVNCARGALIDEKALADALNAGRLAGAAVDVFENEPPKGSPLLTAKNMVMTPHLAASTSEAQLRVSMDAVEALLAYLLRGEVRSAVNVTGLPGNMDARGRAFFDLCARMGGILSAWAGDGVERISLATYGESLEEMAATLSWQAMAAVVGPRLNVRLNLVNAREQAKRRGINVEHVGHSLDEGRPESIVLTVQSRSGRHEVEGTVYSDLRPRVVSIDGYRMDLVPERTMVLIFNDDRPGVIGKVGDTFGKAGINIADMALSRRGKTALMALKLDEPMPDSLLETLRSMNPPILSVRAISLPAASESGRNT